MDVGTVSQSLSSVPRQTLVPVRGERFPRFSFDLKQTLACFIEDFRFAVKRRDNRSFMNGAPSF
jgi:hypothetical protein